MDLKKMIDQVVDFIGNNKDIKAQFDKEPDHVMKNRIVIYDLRF